MFNRVPLSLKLQTCLALQQLKDYIQSKINTKINDFHIKIHQSFQDKNLTITIQFRMISDLHVYPLMVFQTFLTLSCMGEFSEPLLCGFFSIFMGNGI